MTTTKRRRGDGVPAENTLFTSYLGEDTKGRRITFLGEAPESHTDGRRRLLLDYILLTPVMRGGQVFTCFPDHEAAFAWLLDGVDP